MTQRATLADIEEAMADLARLMKRHGDHGMAALPIFERLERERDRRIDIDTRLDAAIARRHSATRAMPPAAHGSTSE